MYKKVLIVSRTGGSNIMIIPCPQNIGLKLLFIANVIRQVSPSVVIEYSTVALVLVSFKALML